MSDSNDDNHSVSELDDMMYLMSGTVENEDTDVEEVNIGAWNMVRDYETTVEVDGVDQHLLAIAREEVTIVLNHVRVQIFGGKVRHLHTLSPARFLEAWMDQSFLCYVKQYINKNLSGNPVSNSEILVFIRVELMLLFYRVSPSLYFDLDERSNFRIMINAGDAVLNFLDLDFFVAYQLFPCDKHEKSPQKNRSTLGCRNFIKTMIDNKSFRFQVENQLLTNRSHSSQC